MQICRRLAREVAMSTGLSPTSAANEAHELVTSDTAHGVPAHLAASADPRSMRGVVAALNQKDKVANKMEQAIGVLFLRTLRDPTGYVRRVLTLTQSNEFAVVMCHTADCSPPLDSVLRS